jgi:predicted permease
VAILTLALALGVNTAIFSVLNAVLLKSLPVKHPNELVLLTDPNASLVLGGMLQGERSLLTYEEFVKLHERATTLSDLCGVQLTLEQWPLRIAGSEPEQARGRLVSESYFSTFGVRPAIGRFFKEEDASAVGKDPYAVISYDYWLRRFGGSPTVIGTTLRLRNASLTIIGVTAKGFEGETVGQRPDIWIPILMEPLVMPGIGGLHDMLPNSTDKLMWLHVFGREKAGLTIKQVQAEINVLFRAILEASYPGSVNGQTRKEALNQYIKVKPGGAGAFHGRKEFGEEWSLLLALAGLILLVACANVANLLLARATSRSREVAIRLAIGAPRLRLVRQFLTENLLLAVIGGLLGACLAEALLRTLIRILSDANGEFSITAGLDWRVLAFTGCATLLTGLLFGSIPALRAIRSDPNQGLKESSRGTTGSRRQAVIAKTLVVMQVALSLLLLAGAGLFLKTLRNLQAVRLGYPKENLLLVEIDPTGYEGAHLETLLRDLTGKVEQLPGVRSVSYSGHGLFSGFEGAFAVGVEEFTSNKEADIGSTGDFVGPEYFSTVGIPMLSGRPIIARDLGHAPRVCVINAAFAENFFAGRNPIGEHVTTTLPDESGHSVQQRLEVVGVAGNARVQSLRGDIDPKFYIPGSGKWLEVRTASEPSRFARAVRKAILGVDSQLGIPGIHTLEETLSAQTAQSRLIAQLAGGFAVVALMLAATGVYGLLSYELVRRTNEIGIRMALGAQKRQVLTMIFKETQVMMIAGVMLGIAATSVIARILASQLYGLNTDGPRWSLARYEHVDSAVQLYGVAAMDPITIGSAAVCLLGIALLAAYLPAKRAAALEPLQALRDE